MLKCLLILTLIALPALADTQTNPSTCVVFNKAHVYCPKR